VHFDPFHLPLSVRQGVRRVDQVGVRARSGKRDAKSLRIPPNDPASHGQALRWDSKVKALGHLDRVGSCDRCAAHREVSDFAPHRRLFEHNLPDPHISNATVFFHTVTLTMRCNRAALSANETVIKAAR
jgi:hypothetical protein